MNLEEFKQRMNTEAQERCNQQEKTIKDLHAKIAEQQNIIRSLQNRCYVQTGGVLCLFCGKEVKSTCPRFTGET